MTDHIVHHSDIQYLINQQAGYSQYENINMIQHSDIQYLIDKHAGYGQDEYSQSVLSEHVDNEGEKHLFSRKGLYLLLRKYTGCLYREQHGRDPKTQAEHNTTIRRAGKGNGTRYAEEDILNMLANPAIQQIMESRIRQKTVMLFGIRTPKVVAKHYLTTNPQPDDAPRDIHAEIIQSSTNELLKIMRTVANELNRREDSIEQQKERETE